jgi:hypothetical protein
MHPHLIGSKQDLPRLENFEIKYVFEGLEEMNNFLHRHLLRFKTDLELKFREISRVEFDIVSS